MQCEACFTRFHLSTCCNIDTAKYEALEKNDLLSVTRWFCKKCDKGVMQFASELLDIKERLTALENRTDVKAIVKEVVQDHLKEEAEIEKRKLNVIVQGLPEPALEVEDQDGETRPTTGEERKNADVTKLISIGSVNPDMSISVDDIDTLFRIGAIRDDGKPRPMCVKLRSPETRRRLISQARLLRNSTTEWHKRVFLNPDLTLEQRNRDRAAREELKRRRQNGEENLTIRNFEVVPFRRSARGGHQVGRDIA